MPDKSVPSSDDLARQEEAEERRVRRNLRNAIVGLIAGVAIIVLAIAGFLFGPRLLSPADRDKPKTNVTDEQQPKTETPQAATGAQAAQPEAIADTPDGYLALLSMDPAAVPPAKKPIAEILNNAGAESAHAGAAELAFLENVSANLLQPLQTVKTKDDLERLRVQGNQLKEIAQQTEASFNELQQSLTKRLQAAGVPPELADQTAVKFVDRARTYRGGESDPGLDAGQATMAIADILEEHPKEWSRRDDGTLVIKDRQLLAQYQKLNEQLSDSINRLSSRASGH